MKVKDWKLIFILFSLGLAAALLAAFGQAVPGYMDAEYYYASGMRLAGGHGFTEPFLWNYLDNPVGIPHPSHLYWMPLASILAGAAMKLMGSSSFWAARAPFIILSGLVPVLSAELSIRLGGTRKHAWLAGLLAILPGIYLVYYSLTETFVLYMLVGGLIWLFILQPGWESFSPRKFCLQAGFLGILAGFMHLSRADGIIWLAGIIGWVVWSVYKANFNAKLRIVIISLIIIGIGYGLVMGAWYARNLNLFGTLFAAGNSRGLWITSYNQTFNYPADGITLANWRAAGIEVHAQAWWNALVMNLKNLVAVQGLVFLLPLAIVRLWTWRKNRGIQFLGIMGLATFGLMTVVFPYAGARGGYLHSASAFQTVIWAAVPLGLDRFIAWGQKKRNWQPRKAFPVFAAFIISMSLLLTGWFYFQKIGGLGNPEGNWDASYTTYKSIDTSLGKFGANPDTLFMVNDPPGFWLATGKSAIVIPGGEIGQAIAAARRYGAAMLILEPGQENLADLYAHPKDLPGLNYLGDLGAARIFFIGGAKE